MQPWHAPQHSRHGGQRHVRTARSVAFANCAQLNFQLKATGPTVTKFFMVMTGYIHWAGCMWYLLSELVIRFNIIDGDPTIEVAPNILCSVGGQSIVLRFRISCRTSPGATVHHVPGLTM